jgi:hypothetical protein
MYNDSTTQGRVPQKSKYHSTSGRKVGDRNEFFLKFHQISVPEPDLYINMQKY